MALFDNIPTPVPLSPGNALKARAKLGFKKIHDTMIREYYRGFNDHWKNVDGLTPPQAFAAWGTEAAQYLQAVAITEQALGIADSSFVPLDKPNNPVTGQPWVIALNADGSVTLS